MRLSTAGLPAIDALELSTELSTHDRSGVDVPNVVLPLNFNSEMQPITPPSPEVTLDDTSSIGSTQKVSSSVRSNRRRRKQQAKLAKATQHVANVDCNAYRECLEQAEICREQARAAARLKRFKAARGLFATAVSLCQRALGLKTQQPAQDEEAQEYLRQLTMEMSTYSELAKSMERPLSGNSAPSIHESASSLSISTAMPVAATSPSFSNSSMTSSVRPKPSGC